MEKETARALEQFFAVDSVGGFAGIFAVADKFHRALSHFLQLRTARIACATKILIELSARRARRAFALTLLGLTRFLRVEAALFAAADATMGPQPLENHFRCCGGGAGMPSNFNADAVNSVHAALEF